MSENAKKLTSFSDIARQASCMLCTPYAFAVASATVLVWALTGPLFGYSDTSQLIINTGTTIVTFLMVFLIQHTQNRDARALQLKLDELLRAVEHARTDLIDVEEDSDEQLAQLQRSFHELRRRTPHAAAGEPPSG